ncbi:MAG: type I secretion protein TolC, partial [Alphaproteobacteria bacterium]|nr:type I secretion protein TolC [Alphaproteobacteria bacterium]
MFTKQLFKAALTVSAATVLALSAGGAWAQQATNNTQQITLRDAVAIGIATNPEHGIVANNRRATDEELRQAKSLYRPSIDF